MSESYRFPAELGEAVSTKTAAALLAGVLLLAAAGFWKFGLASHWTQRLPAGWSWEANYIGISTYPDSVTGEFPTADTPGVYQRSIRIAGGDEVEDAYTTRDIATGQVTWEYITRSKVDRATGKHLAPEARGAYLVFPRHVKRETYTIRSNYIEGLPFSYQGETEVEGIRTYRFAYRGAGEYTESYQGSAEYPGIEVAPGHEIRCSEDQLSITFWVEPLTGEILKSEEACESGDYIYEIATGKKGAAVLRWSGATAGDDVLIRADKVRSDRTRILWYGTYIPVLAALSGVILLAAAGAVAGSRKFRARRGPPPDQ